MESIILSSQSQNPPPKKAPQSAYYILLLEMMLYFLEPRQKKKGSQQILSQLHLQMQAACYHSQIITYMNNFQPYLTFNILSLVTFKC